MPRIIIADEERTPEPRGCLETVGCLVIGILAIIGLGTVLLTGLAILANA
jgi:hypothetical protein